MQYQQQMKFWQLLRTGGMKTKRKRKRKSLLLPFLSFTSTNCQSWMMQEKRSSVGNADGDDVVRRTTRACSRAGVVDYFIDLFAPCWPVLHGSLSCSLLVLTAQMRRRHLTAVPELAIALLFCCGTGRFSQCLQDGNISLGLCEYTSCLHKHNSLPFYRTMNRITMT